MIKTSRKTKTTLLKSETPAPAVAKPGPARAELPKTAKPGHISLELVQPDAKSVCVAGSFNQWKPDQTPLVAKGNGRWVGDLAVPPGRYEYLFVVDGQWLPDPNARETVQNPFGGKNSVLTVSE
jgi:1,4-alpha-glucan branching enzyme